MKIVISYNQSCCNQPAVVLSVTQIITVNSFHTQQILVYLQEISFG